MEEMDEYSDLENDIDYILKFTSKNNSGNTTPTQVRSKSPSDIDEK